LSKGKKSSRDFRTNSKAMRIWKEKYYKKTNSNTSNDNVENVFEKKYKAHKEKLEAKPSLPESNVKHIAMNKILIAFAVSGSVLLLLGYSLGPEGCENSTIFEAVGKLLFFMSMGGICVNLFILFISLFDNEFNSGIVLGWGFLHATCWFVCAMISVEALISDAWCNGNGPSYDIGAGF